MVPPASFASGNSVMTALLSTVVVGAGFLILVDYAMPVIWTNAPYVTLRVVAVVTATIVIDKQIVGGIVLAALVGTVLPYAINIVHC